MNAAMELVMAVDDRTIAREVGIAHDSARARFSLPKNTVDSMDEFTQVIGEYVNFHTSRCVSHGGSLSSVEAVGRAKELIKREYSRRRGDLVTAYNNAHDGTENGLRGILDLLADALKAESVQRYVQEMFDRYIAPNDWSAKVEIIRQFIANCGVDLSSTIDVNHPEHYAANYADLIKAHVDAKSRFASVARRL